MTRKTRNPVREQHQRLSIPTHGSQTRPHHPSQPNDESSNQPPPPLPYPPHVLTSLTLLNPASQTKTHIIHPAHGHAFLLPPGKSFRVVDLHGEQVVDLMAWTDPGNPSGQHTSMSYTRYSLKSSAPPLVGEALHSNLGAPMLEVKADTVKCHDMLFMACNPRFYADMGLQGHRNCAENISGEVRRLCGLADGFGWNHVIDPFNIFQNTPYYSLKALGSSKPGDHVEFANVLPVDLVVGLSCCPFEADGFNGGRVTSVAVVVEL